MCQRNTHQTGELAEWDSRRGTIIEGPVGARRRKDIWMVHGGTHAPPLRDEPKEGPQGGIGPPFRSWLPVLAGQMLDVPVEVGVLDGERMDVSFLRPREELAHISQVGVATRLGICRGLQPLLEHNFGLQCPKHVSRFWVH